MIGIAALNTGDQHPRLGSFTFLRYKVTTIAYFLVAFVLILFTFEESVYGRLGLAGIPLAIVKTFGEVLLYATLIWLVLYRTGQGIFFRYHPTIFDALLVAFVVAGIASTIINKGSPILGIISIRTMLRYVAVFYIITISGWRPSATQISNLIKLVVFLALVQSGLIVIQHLGGDAFREAYFSSAKMELEVSGLSKLIGAMETKIGAGYGTFGKTPLAAFYLLFAEVLVASSALASSKRAAWKWWLAYVVIFIGIFFTYKRAPMLLAAIAPVLVARFGGYKQALKKMLLLGLVGMPVAVAVLTAVQPDEYVKEKESEVSPLESLSQLFSSEYWDRSSSSSRGWMIMEVGSQALASFKPLGYGADEERAKAELAKKGGEFAKLVGWGAFDDVYLVAGLVYYGPVGVGLILSAFYIIYRRSKRLIKEAESREIRIVALSVCTMMIFMLLSSFVVRLLEFRAFIYLFWVFAGIVMTAQLHRSESK